MAKIEEIIAGIVEPIIEENGMELVDIEFIKEGQEWCLRIFIDKDIGITLDDCALISRAVDKVLDDQDPISQAYHLEVSSAGLERPLKKTKDFQRFQGCLIQVKTFAPITGKKKFVGKLATANDVDISIEIENETMIIPREKISKVNLVWEG
ncbi:MAG: hypothetical protein JM58_05315 [Peptococcaceae bacterium BICA1-8]|nr:MAG: hypothetical protein JM58_05315 [Peptococcaceae bacterium BICA1-8]